MNFASHNKFEIFIIKCVHQWVTMIDLHGYFNWHVHLRPRMKVYQSVQQHPMRREPQICSCGHRCVSYKSRFTSPSLSMVMWKVTRLNTRSHKDLIWARLGWRPSSKAIMPCEGLCHQRKIIRHNCDNKHALCAAASIISRQFVCGIVCLWRLELCLHVKLWKSIQAFVLGLETHEPSARSVFVVLSFSIWNCSLAIGVSSWI